MKKLQAATLAAQRKTGLNIGVSVKSGLFKVVEVKKKQNGNCDVKPLSKPLDLESAVNFLNSL